MLKTDQHQLSVKLISQFQVQGCSQRMDLPMVEANTETQLLIDQPLSQVVDAANRGLAQEERALSLLHPTVLLQSEPISLCGNRVASKKSVEKTRKNNLISNSNTELCST